MKYAAAIFAGFIVTGIADINATAQRKPKASPTPQAPAQIRDRSVMDTKPIECSSPTGLTSAEMGQILADHNSARGQLGLPPLKWDCGLARYAMEWASKGNWHHRDESNYGENIFVSSESNISVIAAVSHWMSEKANYNATTNTCAPDRICTHYTQINWRKTLKVGCAMNREVSGKWAAVVVCNYDPPGNTGGKPF